MKRLAAWAGAAVVTATTLAAPSVVAGAQTSVRTVSVTTLCTAFGTAHLSCHGGRAVAAGKLTHYRVRGTTPFEVKTVRLMAAATTSCRRMTLTFWGTRHATTSKIRIVTHSGTYRATSHTTHPATVHAKLDSHAFRITLTQLGTVQTQHVYINGHARCTTKSGTP